MADDIDHQHLPGAIRPTTGQEPHRLSASCSPWQDAAAISAGVAYVERIPPPRPTCHELSKVAVGQ
jgi:hypothetical protein